MSGSTEKADVRRKANHVRTGPGTVSRLMRRLSLFSVSRAEPALG